MNGSEPLFAVFPPKICLLFKLWPHSDWSGSGSQSPFVLSEVLLLPKLLRVVVLGLLVVVVLLVVVGLRVGLLVVGLRVVLLVVGLRVVLDGAEVI